MKQNLLKVDVVNKPNALITVIGRDMGAVSASSVESVIDYTLPEARLLVEEAKNKNKFKPLITDDDKIKSIIVMVNGQIYPSTFRVVTLIDRIKNATSEYKDIVNKTAA